MTTTHGRVHRMCHPQCRYAAYALHTSFWAVTGAWPDPKWTLGVICKFQYSDNRRKLVIQIETLCHVHCEGHRAPSVWQEMTREYA